MDESDPVMRGLKHKSEHIKGRCRFCKYKEICTGSMRVRGYRIYNDPWAPDPACYLTDEEIGLHKEKKEYLKGHGEEFPMPAEINR